MQGKMQNANAPMYPVDGFPIEMISTDKKGETAVIRYKDIQLNDIDRSVFDVTGIKVMEIGF